MSSSVCIRFITSAALLAAIGLGCSKDANPSRPAAAAPARASTTLAAPMATAEPPGISEAARVEAKELFASRCTPCHGPQGGGDGPASAGLTPPPANFQQADWQARVTDAHIETIIQYGGAAVGRSAAMPPNPDLADKPVVKALREHIRGLGK